MSCSPAASVRVGVEQLAVQVGAPEANLELMSHRASTALRSGAQLVVFPELAVSGYLVDQDTAERVAEPLDGNALDRMVTVAREHDGLIAYGFCERDAGNLFNSVVVADGNGPVLHYRKLHLFDQEKAVYAPGDLGLPVAETQVGTIAVCICYDLRFVEVMRLLALRGADLVVAPAAWVAGFDRTVPATGATGQVTIVLAQANLNQVAVAAVSQASGGVGDGPSTLGGLVVCDAYGELIVGPLSRTEPDSAIATIDLAAVRTSRLRSATIRPREDRRSDV
jgi:N-carbamoylputrescine amidase